MLDSLLLQCALSATLELRASKSLCRGQLRRQSLGHTGALLSGRLSPSLLLLPTAAVASWPLTVPQTAPQTRWLTLQ